MRVVNQYFAVNYLDPRRVGRQRRVSFVGQFLGQIPLHPLRGVNRGYCRPGFLRAISMELTGHSLRQPSLVGKTHQPATIAEGAVEEGAVLAVQSARKPSLCKPGRPLYAFIA